MEDYYCFSYILPADYSLVMPATTDPDSCFISEIFLLRKCSTWDSIFIEFVIRASIGRGHQSVQCFNYSGRFINLVSYFSNFLKEMVYQCQMCEQPAFRMLIRTRHFFLPPTLSPEKLCKTCMDLIFPESIAALETG